jgi:hypothetical protein
MAVLKLATALLILLIPAAGTSSAQNCLHGPRWPAQKARRNARSTRDTDQRGAGGRSPAGQAARAPRLANIHDAAGFEPQFHTDGTTYSSIGTG